MTGLSMYHERVGEEVMGFPLPERKDEKNFLPVNRQHPGQKPLTTEAGGRLFGSYASISTSYSVNFDYASPLTYLPVKSTIDRHICSTADTDTT